MAVTTPAEASRRRGLNDHFRAGGECCERASVEAESKTSSGFWSAHSTAAAMPALHQIQTARGDGRFLG